MDSVWLLWFEQKREGDDDTELLIGVHRTEPGARGAIERLRDQPGFREYPQGFHICERVLDSDSWTDGFVRS